MVCNLKFNFFFLSFQLQCLIKRLITVSTDCFSSRYLGVYTTIDGLFDLADVSTVVCLTGLLNDLTTFGLIMRVVTRFLKNA
jgi:hypothetical protein